jgi:hypothetical protein
VPQSFTFFFAYNFPWKESACSPKDDRVAPAPSYRLKKQEVKPMTLARCRRCGKIASTAATTCPHCGVRNPTRKPVNPFIKLAIALTGAALLLGVVESTGLRTILSQTKIDLPHIPLAVAAPAAVAESPGKKREKHRLAVTTSVASTLKKSMDNPGSLIWETILSNDDADVICFEYRVKDNHGEYSREFITYADGKTSEAPEDWNKHCAGKKLNNMIRVRDAV